MDRRGFILEYYQVPRVNEEMLARLEEIISELSPQEAAIVRLRLDKGYSYDMIAKEFGLSKERVGEILRTVYLKLKHPARRRRVVGEDS